MKSYTWKRNSIIIILFTFLNNTWENSMKRRKRQRGQRIGCYERIVIPNWMTKNNEMLFTPFFSFLLTYKCTRHIILIWKIVQIASPIYSIYFLHYFFFCSRIHFQIFSWVIKTFFDGIENYILTCHQKLTEMI